MEDDRGRRIEIDLESPTGREGPESETESARVAQPRALLCDRCGFEMFEANCKVICPNCGSRYDCSDLTIYFD